VLIGLSLNVDLGLKEWVGSSLYNAQVDWSDGQFTYIMKPLGAFMIALGIMAALAARDPLGNRPIIIGFVALFTMRGLQRLLFMDEIERVFAIPASRSLIQMVVMLSMALALWLLLRAAAPGRDVRAVTAA
jgi:branched-subunit amino acid ABC-type transport system permease component